MAIPRLNPLFKTSLCLGTSSLPISQCLVTNNAKHQYFIPSQLNQTPVLSLAAAFSSTSSSSEAVKEDVDIEHWPSRRELVDTLNGQVEAVLRHLKLEPNLGLSGPDRIRIGSKGSLSIVARMIEANGTKYRAGTWYNFETEEKGDMLTLVGKHKGLQGKNLYKYAVT